MALREAPTRSALKPALNNLTTLREMVKLASDHTNPMQNGLVLSNWLAHALAIIERVTRSPEKNRLKFVMYLGEEQMMFALTSIMNVSHPDCLLNMWEHENKEFINCENEFSKIGSQISMEIHYNDSSQSQREHMNDPFYVHLYFNGKLMNMFNVTTTNLHCVS